MRIKEIIETATVGGTSAGGITPIANPTAARAKPKKTNNGAPVAPQATKPDGTVKNALDMPNNIMGGKPIKR